MILKVRALVPTGVCRALYAHPEMNVGSYARRIFTKNQVEFVDIMYLRIILKYAGTYFFKLEVNDFEGMCLGANGPA